MATWHAQLPIRASCELVCVVLGAQADTEHKLGSWLIETFANSPLGLSAEQGAISLQYASASPDINGALASCTSSLLTMT